MPRLGRAGRNCKYCWRDGVMVCYCVTIHYWFIFFFVWENQSQPTRGDRRLSCQTPSLSPRQPSFIMPKSLPPPLWSELSLALWCWFNVFCFFSLCILPAVRSSGMCGAWWGQNILNVPLPGESDNDKQNLQNCISILGRAEQFINSIIVWGPLAVWLVPADFITIMSVDCRL